MEKRTLFYWGKLFLEGIKQGEDYLKLAKVITVNILDFNFLPISKFHSTYHLWDDGEENAPACGRYLLTDLIEIHFIELPKFKLFGPKDLRGNPLHRWLKFFDKKITEEELEELMTLDSAIKRAEKRLEYISGDEDALALYRAREDSAHERANLIYTGRMEGIEEGIEKGIEERTIQIAKNMLAKKTPLDYIAEVTGLSIEEIKAIQAKINEKIH